MYFDIIISCDSLKLSSTELSLPKMKQRKVSLLTQLYELNKMLFNSINCNKTMFYLYSLPCVIIFIKIDVIQSKVRFSYMFFF